MLHPQTPSRVAKDQLTMKDKRDEEEKLEKQKKKEVWGLRILTPLISHYLASGNGT